MLGKDTDGAGGGGVGVAGSYMADQGSEPGQWDQLMQGLSRQGGRLCLI